MSLERMIHRRKPTFRLYPFGDACKRLFNEVENFQPKYRTRHGATGGIAKYFLHSRQRGYLYYYRRCLALDIKLELYSKILIEDFDAETQRSCG